MKEEWEKVRLDDIAYYVSERISIENLKKENYISTENMLAEKNGITQCATIPDATSMPMYKSGDVLVSNIRPYFKKIWYANREGGCSNDVIIFRVKNTSKTDSRYLYYLLSQDAFFEHMMAGANGTKMPRGNKKLIPNFEFFDFNFSTQQKIAAVLGAYDDLIENNRKQIKLLEKAAQKLYKEWFVELHFPGWENTKIVDGIPEGWKKGHIVDIGEFKRGKTITKDQTIPGSVPVVAGGLEPAYYHNVANTESPVITVSGSGANAGFTRLYNEKVWALDCSFLDASKCENLFFIYCCLKTATATIDNLQKGAAQPHVYAKDINALEMLIPNDEVLSNFDLIVKNYFIKIKDCQVTIRKSQATRDELLPKLMSGEIDVSEIKLPTVEE